MVDHPHALPGRLHPAGGGAGLRAVGIEDVPDRGEGPSQDAPALRREGDGMTRVDGSEPKVCNKCGQSSEDFSYLLMHSRTCRKEIDKMLAELILLRRVEGLLRHRRASEPL